MDTTFGKNVYKGKTISCKNLKALWELPGSDPKIDKTASHYGYLVLTITG